MTRCERVKAAIAHRETDRVPSCIHLAGDGQEAHFDRLYKEYVSDDLKAKVETGELSREHAIYYGIGNHVLVLGCPWWGWHDLPPAYAMEDTPEELPKTIGYGSYEEFARTVRSIKENTDAYVLVTIWGSHFEKAYFARGIENFLADMAADPEYAQRLLGLVIRKNLVMLENIVHTPGIDGILLGSDWGSQKDLLMSPEVWREMIADGERQEYELIHAAGLDVWVHSCGNIQKILPDIAQLGVDVLNPVQPECMDIYNIKDTYGDKLTFWGGISTQTVLPYGTPEEVVAEARKVRDGMSRGGGYIYAPSQEIQADVPYENLCALIDTANE